MNQNTITTITVEDRCHEVLAKLVKEGHDTLQVNVLCCEELERNDRQFQPQTGTVELILKVVDDVIVEGAISVDVASWPRVQTCRIIAISPGLDGACVQVRIATKEKADRVVLNLELFLHEDVSPLIYQKIFREGMRMSRQYRSVSCRGSIQNVADYIEMLNR